MLRFHVNIFALPLHAADGDLIKLRGVELPTLRSQTFDAFFPLIMVAVLYFLISWLLMQALGYLQAAYAEASGRPVARRQTTWLRPMSGERTHGKGTVAPPLTSVDYVVIGVVILAIAAFEVWFFFFAGSSLRSG